VGYRIQVDQESCQSSGRCAQAAPETFALDEDHLAALLPGHAPSDATLLAIARACPALAIRLFHDDGREVEV
jgi:ferredoxin